MTGKMTFPQGSFEDIFYEGVRCALLHEAKLASYLRIEKGNGFILNDNFFTITSEMVWGLFLSVITSDKNKELSIPSDVEIAIHGKSFF